MNQNQSTAAANTHPYLPLVSCRYSKSGRPVFNPIVTDQNGQQFPPDSLPAQVARTAIDTIHVWPSRVTLLLSTLAQVARSVELQHLPPIVVRTRSLTRR